MKNSNNILSIQSMLPEGFSSIEIQKTYVGIDFGTSTTVVSIASFDNSDRRLSIKPLDLDQLLEDGTRFTGERLPSVIAWYNNSLLVGEGASNLKYKLTRGKDIWFSFKMEMGEDHGAKYYNSELRDNDKIRIQNPKDCVRIFFMYLKRLIVRYCTNHNLSTNIQYAVTIPASFEANQRKELMEALETNDMMLDKQSLIDEPNAAFISYVHESNLSDKPLLISPHYNSKVLVFDFGGGTCDISILEIGKSANGLYSKNLAISKYTKLGGDDVDRYIAYNYLLPRLMEVNNCKLEDFLTKEKDYIVSNLFKIAERLKILICKKISNLMYGLEIPKDIKHSDRKEQISVKIEIETSQFVLRQDNFYLTFGEFSKAMDNIFMKKSLIQWKIDGQEEYNNIFIPIDSAIEKANIRINELDYVLLIGGSAQNPYIQERLNEYFKHSKILIPQDLQTHVSQGAAIHSLLLNGMNKCVIQPITSEPIFVITRDTDRKILMPAGFTIPSDVINIDDLVTKEDKQECIELPICVGRENKMLFNVKITKDGGFPINSPVKLALQMNADKLLLLRAECMGIECMAEPQNPFANKELTTEERMVLVAERQSNLAAVNNGGQPTKSSLINLSKAYENAHNDFMAAETLEQMIKLYSDKSYYNKTGLLYSNSGNHNKAIEFYERAYQTNPNCSTYNFNLGHSIRKRDRKRAKQLLQKAYELEPDCGAYIIMAAEMEEDTQKAKDMRLKAFEILNKRWEQDKLADYEYSWFSSLCCDLGKRNLSREVDRKLNSQSDAQTYYNSENLVGTQSVSIQKL